MKVNLFLYFFVSYALCSSTLIHKATQANDAEALQVILENLEDMQLINKKVDGRTPLLLAAKNGYSGCLAFLLQAGADPNISGEDEAPLHTCCLNGNTIMVKMLLQAGADPNQCINGATTPMELASFAGHLNIMNLLLKNKAEIDSSNRDGKSPLMVCIESQNVDGASLLIRKGASLTHRDHEGQTPLMLAVISGFPVAKLLPLSSVTLLALDKHQRMAIDFCSRIDNENSEMLSDLMNSISLLDCSTKTEFDSLLRYKGGSRYLRSAEGYELLAETIKENHPAVLGWILELGFSVDQCFGGGVSLLHYAALHSTECAKILLRNESANDESISLLRDDYSQSSA